MKRFLKITKNKLGKQFYRGGIFHHTKSYSNFVEKFSQEKYKDKKIINIGSGGHDQIKNAINVDPYRGGANTVKAFGEALPFEDESVDVALCLAVLEHVREPQLIVAEMKRVLKKGGEIYVATPFLQPFHAAPDDYQRWTMNGLRHLLRDFKELETGVAGGPGSAMAWLAVETSQIIFGNALLNRFAKNFVKILVFPLKYLDALLIKKERAQGVSSALYFHGLKE